MRVKVIVLLFYIIILCSFVPGCKNEYKGYSGEHKDLYTVAINSLLGSKGFIYSESLSSPVVEIIEEDSFGRKLFCYSELNDDFGEVSLLISQTSDKQYVYFYPDYNFISGPLSEGNKVKIYGSIKESTIDDPINGFSESEIIQLKELNDWNKELNF